MIRRFRAFDLQLVQVALRRLNAFLGVDHSSELDLAFMHDGVRTRHEGEHRSAGHRTACTRRLSHLVDEAVQQCPCRLKALDDEAGEVRDALGVVLRRGQAFVDETNGVHVQVRNVRRTEMREQQQKEGRVLPKGNECAAAQVDELMHGIIRGTAD